MKFVIFQTRRDAAWNVNRSTPLSVATESPGTVHVRFLPRFRKSMWQVVMDHKKCIRTEELRPLENKGYKSTTSRLLVGILMSLINDSV